MDVIKKEKNRRLTEAIGLIVVGLLIVLFYNVALELFCLVSGVTAIVFGSLCLLGYLFTFLFHDIWLLIRGLFLLLVGISVLTHPGTFLFVLAIAVSLFLLYDGIKEIVMSVGLRRALRKFWWADLVAGIVYFLLGVTLIVVEFAGGDSLQAVAYVAGGSLIANGLFELILVFLLHRLDKKESSKVVSEQ